MDGVNERMRLREAETFHRLFIHRLFRKAMPRIPLSVHNAEWRERRNIERQTDAVYMEIFYSIANTKICLE